MATVLETLVDLKKTYKEIQEQIDIFERDRTEMELIRTQRDEEIKELHASIAKLKPKVEDSTKLYQLYLNKIKSTDDKIAKYNEAIFELKKEIRKSKLKKAAEK